MESAFVRPRACSPRPRHSMSASLRHHASRPRPGLFQVGHAPTSCKSASPRHLPIRPRPGIMQVGLAPASFKSISSRHHPAQPQTPRPGLELSSSAPTSSSLFISLSSFLKLTAVTQSTDLSVGGSPSESSVLGTYLQAHRRKELAEESRARWRRRLNARGRSRTMI